MYAAKWQKRCDMANLTHGVAWSPRASHAAFMQPIHRHQLRHVNGAHLHTSAQRRASLWSGGSPRRKPCTPTLRARSDASDFDCSGGCGHSERSTCAVHATSKMAISEFILNLVVPPSATVALLLSLPLLTVVKTCKFIVQWLTPENVRGKVILITGASSGIGEHIAYQYAKKGARLVLMARREEQLKAVEDRAISYGASDTYAIVGDVTTEGDCKAVVEAAIQKYGRLDHLVNNAGNVNSFFFRDCIDTKALHATVDTDFWGPVKMTYFALPYLRESHGKIMVIASIGSWLPHPREGIYNGAKAGILQFFDTLRVEERGSVGITIVMPGFTESEATAGKLVGEKGDMILDSERRDAHFGPQPMAYAATVAKSAVSATLRGYRYVITPYFYTVLLLWRMIAPEMIDMMFYFQAVKNPAKPANKQGLEATGAQKYLYTQSAQKVD